MSEVLELRAAFRRQHRRCHDRRAPRSGRNFSKKQNVHRLASEILVHICGESCYKYTGKKCEHICRHGFYYIVSLADFRRRRRGKPLRNALFVVKQTQYGMQGRVLSFQEHPFECQSNYGGVAALRCNFDVQDLRRVLPEEHWLPNSDALPHLGNRPDWGYMN